MVLEVQEKLVTDPRAFFDDLGSPDPKRPLAKRRIYSLGPDALLVQVLQPQFRIQRPGRSLLDILFLPERTGLNAGQLLRCQWLRNGPFERLAVDRNDFDPARLVANGPRHPVAQMRGHLVPKVRRLHVVRITGIGPDLDALRIAQLSTPPVARCLVYQALTQ